MTSSRPRKGRPAEDEVHIDERWMASYMDMVTVLMCLFIVLFAMSTVDKGKYEELRNSLATGFGVEVSEAVDIVEGVVVPPLHQIGRDADPAEIAIARSELEELTALRDRIHTGLRERGLDPLVQFNISERGLTIELIGAETFFAPNSIRLENDASTILDIVGPALATANFPVAVEGHADPRGSPAPFPTDWELSAGRATQVLRHLVEQGGVPGERIQSVGFGSSRPATTGTAPSDLAFNRRVDVVVMSQLPDSVRQLLPQLSSEN